VQVVVFDAGDVAVAVAVAVDDVAEVLGFFGGGTRGDGTERLEMDGCLLRVGGF
jgi:hypothetical protein